MNVMHVVAVGQDGGSILQHLNDAGLRALCSMQGTMQGTMQGAIQGTMQDTMHRIVCRALICST